MKIKDVLDKTTHFFREKKIETARLDAEILIAYGLSLKRIDLYLKYDQPLREDELEKLRPLVKRRSQGEPIAYILGQKEFFGIEFKVNPSVLIPRPETEHLVEFAIEWLKGKSFDQPIRILDLGTGSGCLGLTLAKKIPNSLVTLVDISEAAICLAKENCQKLDLDSRVEIIATDASSQDWLNSPNRKWNHKTFEIIISNPPYIDPHDTDVQDSVKKYEPHLALYCEDEGLKFLKEWSQIYSKHLAAESFIAMEMGYLQGQKIKEYFEKIDVFDKIQILRDLSSKERIIVGEKLVEYNEVIHAGGNING